MKKNLFIIALAGTCLAMGFTASIQLFFTKERSDKFTEIISERTVNASWTEYNLNIKPIPRPLHLGELLLVNIYSGEDDGEGWIGGGWYTPKAHGKWKKLLADNPKLAHQAIDLFGRQIIVKINENHNEARKKVIAELTPHIGTEKSSSYRVYYLDIIKEDGTIEKEYFPSGIQILETTYYTAKGQTRIEREGTNINKYINLQHKIDSLSAFAPKQFWSQQLQLFNKYENLIDVLLALDDASLDKYLITAAMENSYRGMQAFELHEFLISKKFITNYPHLMDDYSQYYLDVFPLDLILLTYRASREFPQWNARRFLTEAKAIAKKVKPLLIEQTK